MERAAHEEERRFYNLTGEKNALKYFSTEAKRGVKKTALEYFEKSTGVFNQKGMLTREEIEEMKVRARQNTGNIWHGYISLGKEDSPKIDTPEKCIELIKGTFGGFFKDAKFNAKNLDLMCALHMDRPHHLHIHFELWEKEPKYKGTDGALHYKSKGKIEKTAVENMKIRLGVFLSENRTELYGSRDEALKKLRGMTAIRAAMKSTEEIKSEILSLAKDLPKTGRLAYGSKVMESYRGRVDGIVKMLLQYDGTARTANRKFYQTLEERKREISKLCALHKIDEKDISLIADIEQDYKRRQGNLIIRLAKIVKPELYERNPNRKYKSNDTGLKRRLNISRRKTDRLMNKFLSTFGEESRLLERDFSRRLQEIEQEIEQERASKLRVERRADIYEEYEKEENIKA